jgi:hypothetical protein
MGFVPWLLAKAALALGAIGLVLWRRRQPLRRPSRPFRIALVVAALAGVWGWQARPGFSFVGYWDLYHYYLGSKYFDELGYYDLYGATLAADADGARLFGHFDRVRDIRTQGFVPVREVLEHAAEYRARFAPARWAELVGDLAWFQARIPERTFRDVLLDRGYHPSPAWDRIGGSITNALPITAPATRWLLLAFDPILFFAACGAIVWAWGPTTAALFLLAWGAFPLHVLPLKSAFLRLDWMAAMVASCACYRRKRHGLAGAFLGYAAAVRLFPAVFAGAVVARAAWDAWEKRPLGRHARFAMGFAGVGAALFLLGCLRHDGGFALHRWTEFAGKIALHDSVLSHQRSGLVYLVGLGRPLLFWPSALLLGFGLVVAVRRMDRAELVPAGLVLFFAWLAAASYYHIVACVLVFHFHRRRRADAAGLVAFFACCALAAMATVIQGEPVSAELSFLWSVMLLGLSLLVVGSAPAASSPRNAAGVRS